MGALGPVGGCTSVCEVCVAESSFPGYGIGLGYICGLQGLIFPPCCGFSLSSCVIGCQCLYRPM